MQKAVILAVLPFFLAGPLAATELLPKQLGVEAAIDPAGEGEFICVLRLTDLENGRLFAAPTLRFRDGQPGELTISSADGKSGWRVDVAVDEGQNSVRLAISVVRDGVGRIVHQLNVRLR